MSTTPSSSPIPFPFYLSGMWDTPRATKTTMCEQQQQDPAYYGGAFEFPVVETNAVLCLSALFSFHFRFLFSLLPSLRYSRTCSLGYPKKRLLLSAMRGFLKKATALLCRIFVVSAFFCLCCACCRKWEDVVLLFIVGRQEDWIHVVFFFSFFHFLFLPCGRNVEWKRVCRSLSVQAWLRLWAVHATDAGTRPAIRRSERDMPSYF